jgi:hypothetical protein
MKLLLLIFLGTLTLIRRAQRNAFTRMEPAARTVNSLLGIIPHDNDANSEGVNLKNSVEEVVIVPCLLSTMLTFSYPVGQYSTSCSNSPRKY